MSGGVAIMYYLPGFKYDFPSTPCNWQSAKAVFSFPILRRELSFCPTTAFETQGRDPKAFRLTGISGRLLCTIERPTVNEQAPDMTS